MKKRQLIFYGWIIVATALIVQALGYGTRYSFAIIFPSLLDTFQWSRDVTAAMLSIHLLVYGFVCPVAGGLVDRIGPRKTMTFGVMVLALGLALSAWADKPWHFYLSFGVIAGIGLALAGTVPFATVLRNWFERRRGLAFALMFLGGGAAHAFYPAIAFLIANMGWRNTFLVEAIGVVAILITLIILVVRYHPREKGLTPDGGLASEATLSTAKEALHIVDKTWAAIDWTLAKAVRTSRFWLLCLTAFAVIGVMEHVMVAHHFAFATDMGYPRLYASSILSLFGILMACGSLVALVSDWIGRETTVTIGTIIGISGIVVLTLIDDASQPWMLYYYAVALGFGFGLSVPTIVAATTDIFQGPKAGTIIGAIWFAFALGGTLGPWLGGWIYEVTDSYLPAFYVAIASFAVACLALWAAAPRKVRLVTALSR